jgi:uncharacterized protein (TIRG00374 family)
MHRSWSDVPIQHLVGELVLGRARITDRRAAMLLLVLIQLGALIGHALALLVVLYSLGDTTQLVVVLAAFGIALITSTFNVLPGGGGTVEAVLALVLTQLGGGNEAIIAAVIFRLLSFWLLTPLAVIGYRWLMHGAMPAEAPRYESQTPLG